MRLRNAPSSPPPPRPTYRKGLLREVLPRDACETFLGSGAGLPAAYSDLELAAAKQSINGAKHDNASVLLTYVKAIAYAEHSNRTKESNEVASLNRCYNDLFGDTKACNTTFKLQILECADDSSLCAVEKAALIKLFLVYSLASSIPRSFILLSLSS